MRVATLIMTTSRLNLFEADHSGLADGSAGGIVTGNVMVPSAHPDSTVGVRRPNATIAPEDLASLMLAPGFLLDVSILDEPDIAGSFRVNQHGDLDLPIVGVLHVAGQTLSEAKTALENKLRQDKLLLEPQVTLTVLEYTAPQVTILGQVLSPGRYPLLAPHNLMDVLALAGGPTAAAGNEVKIARGNDPAAVPETIRFSRHTDRKTVNDVIVRPGDTVQVEMAGIIYVLGAVNRPGGYVMQEGGTLNVLEALSLANGTNISLSGRTIHVLRPNSDGSVVDIPLSAKRLFHGETSPVVLQAKDIVYVPANGFKVFLSSSILASTASASIYRF
jgi:polysaccharide export outer membrane protein